MQPFDIAKRLYMRFTTIYGEKFTRNHPTDDFVQMWWEDWAMGIAGLSPESIKKALQNCMMNLEWPPSIAEFRRLCESEDGLPTFEEALQKALSRDFGHPAVQEAFNTVGSWDFTHDTAIILRRKFQIAWKKAVDNMRKPHLLDHKESSNGLESGTKQARVTGNKDERLNMAAHAVDFLPRFDGQTH